MLDDLYLTWLHSHLILHKKEPKVHINFLLWVSSTCPYCPSSHQPTTSFFRIKRNTSVVWALNIIALTFLQFKIAFSETCAGRHRPSTQFYDIIRYLMKSSVVDSLNSFMLITPENETRGLWKRESIHWNFIVFSPGRFLKWRPRTKGKVAKIWYRWYTLTKSRCSHVLLTFRLCTRNVESFEEIFRTNKVESASAGRKDGQVAIKWKWKGAYLEQGNMCKVRGKSRAIGVAAGSSFSRTAQQGGYLLFKGER